MEDRLMPAAGYILLRKYSLSGHYKARQKEDIILATTSNEGGEGKQLGVEISLKEYYLI